MEQIPCSVDNQGRITIPAAWRKDHGVEAGDTVMVTMRNDHLQIQTRDQALTEAQQIVASYVKVKQAARSLVDQLVEERRREALAETEEASRHGEGH